MDIHKVKIYENEPLTFIAYYRYTQHFPYIQIGHITFTKTSSSVFKLHSAELDIRLELTEHDYMKILRMAVSIYGKAILSCTPHDRIVDPIFSALLNT